MTSKPTAVPWHRLLAFVVDTVVICAVIAVAWLLLTEKIPKDQVAPGSGGFDIGDKRYAFSEENAGNRTLWLLISLASAIVVSIVIPAVSGSSPGRAVAGIRVVDEQGQSPGFVRSLVRWLLWIVDGFFFWLVGGIMVLATERNQRLGDMAAKTFTVRRADAGKPVVFPSQGQGYAPGYAPAQPGYAPAQPGYGPAQGAGSGSAPGWHPDPHGVARLRWWDGQQWTDHTSP